MEISVIKYKKDSSVSFLVGARENIASLNDLRVAQESITRLESHYFPYQVKYIVEQVEQEIASRERKKDITLEDVKEALSTISQFLDVKI